MVWIGAAVAAGPKLLEPERAFAFSVQALDERTVEARFAIANGYYLYREKLHFSVEPARLGGAPVLPPGKIKDDEFFGKVETYRGQLAVKLALQQPPPGSKVVVRAESQGCADAGMVLMYGVLTAWGVSSSSSCARSMSFDNKNCARRGPDRSTTASSESTHSCVSCGSTSGSWFE